MACSKILKAGCLSGLKAVNDACRPPRNQWTAASRFLTLSMSVSGTPVVLSVADLP